MSETNMFSKYSLRPRKVSNSRSHVDIGYEPAPESKSENSKLAENKRRAEDVAPTKTAVSTQKRKRVAPTRAQQDGLLKLSETKRKESLKNWKKVWDAICAMRASGTAPVDTMGCEMLADRSSSPKIFRFQSLVSLMLSSQTRDQMTAAAMARLQTRFITSPTPSGENELTVPAILETDEAELRQLLVGVSFHIRKAMYLKQTAAILHDKYDDDIPDTLDGLCSLPGVGPKMAHLCMQVAWNKTVGIGVDVHVHRIANRLGWVHSKTPEETRAQLQKWLPEEYWRPINKLFVGFGQETCTPVHPKCHKCLANEYCPSANLKL